METYIDDVADSWSEYGSAAVKGTEPLRDVVTSGSGMQPGDVTIDKYTKKGQARLGELMEQGYSLAEAAEKLVRRVHYRRRVIPFSEIRELYPDPFKREENEHNGKNYKQAPMRVRH